MYRMQKAMRIKYLLLMIILTISLISLRISMVNYSYIKQYEGYLKTSMTSTTINDKNIE